MLRLDQVRGGYGQTPVLHDVTMDLEAGQTLAVLGHNGAGKTTLLRTIVGLTDHFGGTIELAGREVSHLAPYERARAGLGYVPQGRGIFPGLSVEDNIKVAAYGAGKDRASERVRAILDQFPALVDRPNARGGSLSGGQQQMLAVARALVSEPKVLLLDEPSEGLAPAIIDEITETIASAREEYDLTIVIVEQNLDVATTLASEAVILDKGETVRRLPAGDVLADEEMQREYLGV